MNHTLGIDLGRHRVYVLRSNPESTVVFPMQADHDGLIFRWLGPNGVERVLGHLQELPPDKAMQVSQATCAMIVDRIRAIDESAISDRTLVAVPVLPEAKISEMLVSGFNNAGVYPSQNDFVQRPIASLANWLTERRANGSEGDQLVLTIDNDAGQLSGAVSDPAKKRLLAMAQLSADPSQVDETAEVALRGLLARASHVFGRFPADGDAIETLNSPSSDVVIGNVVLSGMNTNHPDLSRLVEMFAPEAKIWGRGRGDTETMVASGLLRMHQLDGWICPWPTGHLLVDNTVTIGPGVLPLLTDKFPIPADDIRVQTTDQAIVTVSDGAGVAKPTRLGGEDGIGLRLPSRLGNNINVRAGMDGKTSFYGEPSAKPLVIQPCWPVTGTKSIATEVKVIRRGHKQ